MAWERGYLPLTRRLFDVRCLQPSRLEQSRSAHAIDGRSTQKGALAKPDPHLMPTAVMQAQRSAATAIDRDPMDSPVSSPRRLPSAPKSRSAVWGRMLIAPVERA